MRPPIESLRTPWSARFGHMPIVVRVILKNNLERSKRSNAGKGIIELAPVTSEVTPVRIPFNVPFLAGRELEFIQQAINNWHISGDGPFTAKCHSFLEAELGVLKALLTTSCTHALEMAALL